MLTKYKFLFNTLNARNPLLKTLRCAKFTSQPDTKTTVRIKTNFLR